MSVKKKFVDDALYQNSHERVASVYVVVLNRQKNYDPVISQKITQLQRQEGKFKARNVSLNVKSNVDKISSSSEDEAETKARMEH